MGISAGVATGISLAITVASSIAAIAQQAAAAAAQEKQARLQAAVELKNAQAKNAALTERAIQEQDAASAKSDRIRRDMQAAQSLAVTSAAEAGVGGNSVNALIRDATSRGLEGIGAVETNLDISQSQLERRSESVNASYISRVLSLDPGPGVGQVVTGGLLQGAADVGGFLQSDFGGQTGLEILTGG